VPSPKVLSPKEPSTRKPRRSCRESGLAARSWQPRHLFHTFSSSHSQPRTPSYAAESILNSGAAGRLREENLSPATAVGSRGAGRGFVGEMERSPIQSAGRPDDSCSGGSAVKREAVCSAPRCSLRLPPRWSHLGSATHAHRTHVTGRTHELRIRRFRAMCRAPEPQE
jgi:hypothetical protein